MVPLWVPLVGGILGFQALVWTVVLIWAGRKQGRLKATLSEEALAAGEILQRGPEPALYRGATAGYSKVKGNGVILLTNQRLRFRKLTGGRVEVPLDQVVGIREAKTFLHSYRAGRLNLILQLKNGPEVGFMVADEPGWMSAMRAVLGR